MRKYGIQLVRLQNFKDSGYQRGGFQFMQVLPSGPLRQECTLMLRQYLNRNDRDVFSLKTLFSFKYCSSFYLRMVCTYSHSSIAHLERFVQDSEFLWNNGDNKWCQCRGCRVQRTLYRVRSGGAGAKPLLGSGNTVQCQGQVRLGLGQIWVRFGLSLGQVQVRFGLGLENRYEPF